MFQKLFATAMLCACAVYAIESGLDEFRQHIADYRKVHAQAQSAAPPLNKAGKKGDFADAEHELAAKIREARKNARQGDIFTPATAKEFRALIAAAMRGNNDERVRKSLEHAEPVQLALKVNDSFPDGIPLPSTPPTLLLNLPELPHDLDYRIVGETLVLRDADANMVVDFLPNAL